MKKTRLSERWKYIMYLRKRIEFYHPRLKFINHLTDELKTDKNKRDWYDKLNRYFMFDEQRYFDYLCSQYRREIQSILYGDICYNDKPELKISEERWYRLWRYLDFTYQYKKEKYGYSIAYFSLPISEKEKRQIKEILTTAKSIEDIFSYIEINYPSSDKTEDLIMKRRFFNDLENKKFIFIELIKRKEKQYNIALNYEKELFSALLNSGELTKDGYNQNIAYKQGILLKSSQYNPSYQEIRITRAIILGINNFDRNLLSKDIDFAKAESIYSDYKTTEYHLQKIRLYISKELKQLKKLRISTK